MDQSNLDRRSLLQAGALGVTFATFFSVNHALAAPALNERLEKALKRAKRSLPETLAFINAMPKGGDIHNHLEGDIYDTQALRSAIALGLNYDLSTDSFTDRPIGDGIVRASEIESNDSLFLRFRDSFNVHGARRAGKSGREQFFSTFGRFQSSRISLAEVVAGVRRRAAIEQIAYVETISPVIPEGWADRLSATVAEVWSNGIDRALDAIQGELASNEFKDAVSNRLDQWETGTSHDVLVRYLSYALRFLPLQQFLVHAACAAAATRADERVVGFNLVGPEDSIVANRDFMKQLEIVDALWKRFEQPNIALHAGEFTQSEVTVEELRGRIMSSMRLGHARRIGHGISIAWDDSQGETLALMRREKIPVEICLSSNETILGISGNDHPINLYRSAGVPIIFGSDDEGITRSSLTNELAKAVYRYDLSYTELRACLRNSLEFSFLNGPGLFEAGIGLRRTGMPQLANASSAPSASVRVQESQKMEVQRRFEQALAAFEAII